MGDKPVDLVFEGGGVKGIALAGAVLELCAAGYEPQHVAGTSAGAITAAIVAAGYRAQELHDLVDGMHFPDFEDRPRHEWAGPLGDAFDIGRHRGIHSGKYFHNWITRVLAVKKIERFGDLLADPAAAKDDPSRYKLQVIASDLTDASMLVLPRDAPRLGIDADALLVADAVRMSMSIPIFFEPWVVDCRGRKHTIVDGGLLSNFPVWLFDVPPGQRPAYPTFGLLLQAPGEPDPIVSTPDPQAGAEPTKSLVGYIKAVADTAMEAHDRFYVEDENFARTIPLSTLGVKATEFSLPPARAAALLQAGRDGVTAFLKTWDFDAYIAQYRS